MGSHTDEGLLLSLRVYVAAVLGVLALGVLPVVWVNGPTVMENAGTGYARELLAAHRNDCAFPVARLKHRELIPARVVEPAALAGKARRARDRAQHAREARLARQQRAAQRARLAERARRAQY